MALSVLAVEAFTQGRLNRDDEETERQLDAALAAARIYCGWHVTPALTEQTLTLDGPGTAVLALPTLRMTAVTEVTEEGVELEDSRIEWSSRGLIAKASGLPWTSKMGAITVTIDHGYDTAPDFDSVVLSAIDRGAFSTSGDGQPKVIGPFQYDTSNTVTVGAVFSDAELAVLDRYALEKTP
jgi:hypothetical protein